MGDDNGRKPLTFNSPNVPIIGQPFVIKGWFPTVLLACNCGAHESVMIPRGGASMCPACKKVYTIQQVVFSPDGQVQFGIGIMAPDTNAVNTATKVSLP